MTVFNRFKEFPDLVGKNTLDSEKWMIEIKNKRVKNAVDNAIENMYAALKNKDEEVCI
jgi:glucitol operon activator protein